MDKKNIVNVYTTSNGAELNISAPSVKQVISATNNRAQYFSEQAKKYRDEAKQHRDNAKYYSEQNSDVTYEYINNVRAALESKIAKKQDRGDYALREEIPTEVSDLNNDKNFIGKDIVDMEINKIKLPSQEGNTGKFLVTDGANANWKGINTFQLFDTKISDSLLSYEESNGWALQGTYVHKNAIAGERYGYPDFYNKCVEEYNEATDTEIFNGVTVKVNSNGHKFYDIADKTAIDSLFNTMGAAWLYGIDTVNECIFLPRNDLICGDSDTAQSSSAKYLLYFCVGNTVSDTSYIDVVSQVVGGVKDIEDKTLECLERLKQSSIALTQTQITNCLLEVPQRIKLELTDGVLTLKAGSVVTVPNGFEADGTTPKFDEMTIESDLAVIGANQQTFVFYSPMRTDDIHYDYLSSANICSGSTDSLAGVNPHIWYDTTNNLIKVFTNSSTTPARNISFPFCIATAVNNEFTSIDQVFNGMGYIGSTVWVDKGVKVLIPNGRNKDGSLKNIEFTTNNIMTYSRGNAYSDYDLILNEGQIANSRLYLDETNNVMRKLDGGLAVQYATIGKVSADSAGKITSLQPKTTFHAVDYNEKAEIVSWCMPDYSRATTWSTSGGIVLYDAKVILYNTNATNSGGAGGWVTVNGLLEYCVRGNAYEATSPAYVAYLPKGAIVEANNMNFAYIVPLKGVK